MEIRRLFFVLALLLGSVGVAGATEVIPPAPQKYFNDYADAIKDPAVVQQLNGKLEEFERETSNQILVAVFPKMLSDSSIDDYAYHVFQAWRVGQKAKDNGAVLFVFIQDHKCFLQVGSGLRALPDALAKRIIDTEITPRFKQGDYAGGLSAGIDAIIAATKGEYQGTGKTDQEQNTSTEGSIFVVIFILFVALIFVARIVSAFRYAGYSSGGYSSGIGWLWLILSLFSGGGGGGSGGGFGGGGGGGGGGFSGGGGSSGGGGAGGSW